jgi:cytosine/adenosine deaminase-related metal-dependent hydrolase
LEVTVTDRLLIRGGDVIDTEPQPVVRPNTDVLIENGRIVAVGPRLPAVDAEILDGTDRIVLPGFVDTHRHTWQAGLRSLSVNDDNLGAYLELVLRQLAPRFRPEDVHAGNLAGAVECLAAGITTVADYSLLSSFEHGEAAIDALLSAGIRAVYGAGYPVLDESARQPEAVRKLRAQHADGLVTMALAPVGPSFTSIETAAEDWRLADELSLPIAVHMGSGPVAERPVAALRERGLLRPNTLYVHGNSLPDDELRLIADSGGAMSVTPTVEAHLRLGPPMVGRTAALGVTAGLGIDVVTTSGGDMFSQMRAALLTSQLDEFPRVTPADVLRMATLDGARALGLADRIGSLRPGKQADLILLRANDPNLIAARDLVGAVVTAAHPGNIETVLVAGQPVNRTVSASLAGELRRSVEFVTMLRPDPVR